MLDSIVKRFRDAFVSAFYSEQRNIVWTIDRVLKTSVMQSYIYPAIGKYLNLALVCEYPADASYYSWATINLLFDNDLGCPERQSTEVLLEHEIDDRDSVKEVQKLTKLQAPLSVLVTYFEGNVDTQEKWANDKFASILKTRGSDTNRFLIILPGLDPAIDSSVNENLGSRYTPQASWWNFFEWSSTQQKFQRLT